MSVCKSKFSCHLIIKHETHMFSCLEELQAFLEQLRMHSDWERCSDIIDMSVYKKTQLFRVPFAVKAPKYNADSHAFDTITAHNVFIPVDCNSGQPVVRFLNSSRLIVNLPLDRWRQYLLTTPFKNGQQAKPLPSELQSFSCVA